MLGDRHSGRATESGVSACPPPPQTGRLQGSLGATGAGRAHQPGQSLTLTWLVPGSCAGGPEQGEGANPSSCSKGGSGCSADRGWQGRGRSPLVSDRTADSRCMGDTERRRGARGTSRRPQSLVVGRRKGLRSRVMSTLSPSRSHGDGLPHSSATLSSCGPGPECCPGHRLAALGCLLRPRRAWRCGLRLALRHRV